MRAVKFNRPEVIAKLMSTEGINAEARNKEGLRPIDFAIDNNYPPNIVKLLLHD